MNGLASSTIFVDDRIEASGMLMQMKNGGAQLPQNGFHLRFSEPWHL